MNPLSVSVSTISHEPFVISACATALYTLAATKTGATINDLERGEIALAELVEVLSETAEITEVVVQTTTHGFDLHIQFEPFGTMPMPVGSRQVIDAGLDSWQLTQNSAVVQLEQPLGHQNHE